MYREGRRKTRRTKKRTSNNTKRRKRGGDPDTGTEQRKKDNNNLKGQAAGSKRKRKSKRKQSRKKRKSKRKQSRKKRKHTRYAGSGRAQPVNNEPVLIDDTPPQTDQERQENFNRNMAANPQDTNPNFWRNIGRQAHQRQQQELQDAVNLGRTPPTPPPSSGGYRR